MPDKKWVFDAVTLSNFLLSDSMYLIENRYSQKAIVTDQVLDELSAGYLKYPVLKTIDAFIKEKVFSICNMSQKEREIFVELNGQLGRGEASCIAVADKQGWVVVTDDRAARRVCAQKDVAVTGTIGIIKANLFDSRISVSQANIILQKMTDFGFYSPVRKIDDLI